MDLLASILNSQNGGAVSQLARNFGLEQDQAVSAISSLVPALSAGLSRNISGGGLDGLLAALSGGQHQKYLDDVSTLGQPDTIDDGNGILGHILGSKDVSRQVAAAASERTGVGQEVLKRMLPVVASMVMGALSKQSSGFAAQSQQAGAGGDLLGTLSSFLDSNRDGSVADDVLGIVGRLLSK